MPSSITCIPMRSSPLPPATAARALTQEIFGDEIGWLPWKKPGFELGLWLGKFCAEQTRRRRASCSKATASSPGATRRRTATSRPSTINQAIAWFEGKTQGKPAFGGEAVKPLPAAERRAIAAKLMPKIRGLISAERKKLGHFDDSAAVLEFVSSRDLRPLAALGTSCPDHFLRTKIRPLVVEFDPANPDVDALAGSNPPSPPIATTTPPITSAASTPTARRCATQSGGLSRARRRHAHLRRQGDGAHFRRVLCQRHQRDARRLRRFDLSRPAEQEAFDIEYWLLEEAKLQRMPKPKSLAGHIAFVTGGAGGIGRATAAGCWAKAPACARRHRRGRARHRHRGTWQALRQGFRAPGQTLDVTSEEAGRRGLRRNGGGIRRHRHPRVQRRHLLLGADRGHDALHVEPQHGHSREGLFPRQPRGLPLFKQQKIGGNVVFIASKNGLAASPNASAYCTAKAAEIHLARCLALEGADQQIRVNTVNPDAVLRGSKIWTGEWREQRAAAYNMQPDDLEEHYRKRSMLKRSVFPEDIAEAVYFLASDMSAKSTGNIINVDAGNAAEFYALARC
jgi:NAD(P)-dependent dehydrogenase (short-subunit alcohol dehydrogenase family)